jgi:hypothetical protein
LHLAVYMKIYIYMYSCVCVCVRERLHCIEGCRTAFYSLLLELKLEGASFM